MSVKMESGTGMCVCVGSRRRPRQCLCVLWACSYSLSFPARTLAMTRTPLKAFPRHAACEYAAQVCDGSLFAWLLAVVRALCVCVCLSFDRCVAQHRSFCTVPRIFKDAPVSSVARGGIAQRGDGDVPPSREQPALQCLEARHCYHGWASFESACFPFYIFFSLFFSRGLKTVCMCFPGNRVVSHQGH